MEVASLYREPPKQEERAPAALEFNDVFKIFRSGPVETVALRGLDLRINAGEFVAVLGPSGSGKSTFLHLAAGLDEPSAGEVRAFGKPLSRLDEAGLARYRSRDVALVFQSENLLPLLTAKENVATTVRLSGSRRWRESVDDALALAAARTAPLLLADEPTGELDLDKERRVLGALRGLQAERGTTVVTVTHSPAFASAADRVIEISDGRVA